MEEEKYKIEIITEETEKAPLYELFSNPVKDLFVFIGLFLIGYYVMGIFTIEVNIKEPQYIIDAQNNSIKPLKVDISSLHEHRFKKVEWHGLPIGIYKRTKIDFENIANRYPKKKPSEKSELKKKLDTYLLKNNQVFFNEELRSIKQKYFVFIMLRPERNCKLKVHFFHNANNKNKDQYANIVDTCTLQTYYLNGKLSFENYYRNGGYFNNQLYTNNLFIPNHRFIDENTIEFFPSSYSKNNQY